MSNKLPQGHIAGKPVKFESNHPFQFQLTWGERFKVLLGYSVKCEVLMTSQHNPGAHRIMLRQSITSELPPTDAPRPVDLIVPSQPAVRVAKQTRRNPYGDQ